ncbi:uncharacterized protein MELLADRAFT_92608 [Melampsora larici-populina 98AG31]|uniref:Uncharacterized protein n=1 Tax=Melampsora larici-populina (strain 98AG31 / pathotype 3-4-7) TaxID=747676 RepID=F4S261_MELLP|nr:uncharacterized protein MELLADRAFT_92608 [Melampsora larici-populina 98AG31]EGG01302.1 hypothetical protein MELLADRAFT_92608 [Melampsora larici-populina 98AG31]
MSETTGRGNSESVLDPSNPSVNKQTMLDWLRINHPKTPISSKANKAEVAKIVRDKQPEIFGEANPSATSSTLLDHTYPTLENLRVSSPVVPKALKTSENLVKRSASADLDVPKRIANDGDIPGKRIKVEKRTEVDQVGHRSKMTKMKNILHLQRASRPKSNSTKTSRPAEPIASAKPIVSNWIHPLPQAPPPLSPISSLSNEDEKAELEGLKQSIFSPLIDQTVVSNSTLLPMVPSVAPERKPRKPLVNPHVANDSNDSKPPVTTRKNRINKPKEAHTPSEVDLIQFSDTEVFEMGNLVIGRDIPVIQMQGRPDSSNAKTGVDIFQEEQRREQKVKTLEERLAHLESTIEIIEKKASASIFQEVQKQELNGDMIKEHSSLLERAKNDIIVLEAKVDMLETIAYDLQTELDIAFTKIGAHHRVFRKMLGPHSHINLEEEYDADPDENDSSQDNPDSCDNDSTVSD